MKTIYVMGDTFLWFTLLRTEIATGVSWFLVTTPVNDLAFEIVALRVAPSCFCRNWFLLTLLGDIRLRSRQWRKHKLNLKLMKEEKEKGRQNTFCLKSIEKFIHTFQQTSDLWYSRKSILPIQKYWNENRSKISWCPICMVSLVNLQASSVFLSAFANLLNEDNL